MHTRPLLFDVLRLLDQAGLQTWLAGGWAEELRGLCPPRPHNDIDLLYPAESFARVDAFLRSRGQAACGQTACGQTAGQNVEEIQAKHFSHKRAMQFAGVMVELLLVQPAEQGCITSFFDGRYRFPWPADVFEAPLLVEGSGLLRIASKNALLAYRESHAEIARAYQAALSAG
jgi:hypothetical protein